MMVDAPPTLAYRNAPPRTINEINILRNGGVWQAHELPKLPIDWQTPVPRNESMRIFTYKARYTGNGRYDVYDIETNEVVGHIN